MIEWSDKPGIRETHTEFLAWALPWVLLGVLMWLPVLGVALCRGYF